MLSATDYKHRAAAGFRNTTVEHSLEGQCINARTEGLQDDDLVRSLEGPDAGGSPR